MNPSFRDFQIFAIPDPKKWKALLKGKNTKGIFIIYNLGEESGELESFLSKILAAAKIDLSEDTLFLPISSDQPISFAQLLAEHQIETVLVFGRKPEEIGLNLSANLYQPLLLNNIRFIFADDLSAIFKERKEGGKVKSAALWNCLKATFL